MQIKEAIDKYFKYLRVEKGVSNDTILSYHYDLNEFFKVLKKEDTDEFNANDITDFIKLESRRFLSSSTIIRRISSTKNLYLFLEREGIISPLDLKIKTPKAIKKLPVALSIEEVEELLEAPNINKVDGKRDKAMLETMYSSGLRVSELLSLKLDQLNFERGIVEIIGKGNKQRKVPLGEYALEYVNDYIKNGRCKIKGHSRTNYLFLNRYGKYTKSNIQKFKENYTEALEKRLKTLFPKKNFHSITTKRFSNHKNEFNQFELFNPNLKERFEHFKKDKLYSSYSL